MYIGISCIYWFLGVLALTRLSAARTRLIATNRCRDRYSTRMRTSHEHLVYSYEATMLYSHETTILLYSHEDLA